MLLIPAIDLKDGRCVRLRQGRMDDSTIFSDDPVEIAERWVKAGCKRLHLVDLNGAFEGEPVNANVIHRICKICPDVPIQVGGGIRTRDTIATYLDAGVQFVIIGTQAVKTPRFVTDMCHEFSGHVMVGLDAKDGLVAVEGWAEVCNDKAIDIAKMFEDDGVSAVIYTDIACDGMMKGTNVKQVKALAESVSIPIIASGGICQYKDIRELLAISSPSIMGAIIGRAIYEGTINLVDAQKIVDEG